ncbi:MAG: YfiM family protein [Cytophagaceae bacterium]|jgi:hypothetical protein|nr:YfiM family protein [Cytophagaceae bacterium]
MKNLRAMRLIFFLWALSMCVRTAWCDSTQASFNPKRLWVVAGGTAAAYTGSLIALSELWYKNQARSSFHFFNDNHEWMQIDKIGHATTAFHESRLGIRLLEWTGMPRKKAIWYGSFSGFIFQTPIEILDGFSAAYGASAGDLAANTLGSALVLGQYMAWDEVAIQLKYSYRASPYASLRPNILGDSPSQRMLKDYNGQTYWLSANLKRIFFKERKFPAWLNVAVGNGAHEMVYGTPSENQQAGYRAYRQWYLSLDIDTEKIPSKNKWVKSLLFALNVFKVPFPTLVFDRRRGVYGEPLW